MVFYGVDLRYLMMVCLGITVVTDIVALRGHLVFTLIPLGIGFIYHLQHGTFKLAAGAFALPFVFYCIRLVRCQIALYDILEHGMVGVIMGWGYFPKGWEIRRGKLY